MARPHPVLAKAKARNNYYVGGAAKSVTAEERDTRQFVCDKCGLRYQTARALWTHKGKADKPGGAHAGL